MPRVLSSDHPADLPMARGQEEVARKFYGRILGLREVMKTPGERGVWFDIGGVPFRLRVADPLPPPSTETKAKLRVDKAEPFRQALNVARYRAYDAPAIRGTKALIALDPFGNRVELREYLPGAAAQGGERVSERADPVPGNE